MDKKFRSDEQWFISPLICLTTFRDKAMEELAATRSLLRIQRPNEFDDPNTPSSLSEVTGCSKKTEKAVMSDLAIEKLFPVSVIPSSLDTDRPNFEELNVPDNLRPNVFKCHEYAAERNQIFKNAQKKSAYAMGLKYYKADKCHNALSQWNGKLPVPPDDILLTVNVIVPYNKILTDTELRNPRLLQPAMKMLCRGEMLLSTFRRSIKCASDLAAYIEPGKELSQPDEKNFHCVKFPSSFVFIHDTFFIDYSAPNSIDISKEIREFMARKNCFDPVKVVDMKDIRMVDLSLRLGQPYVFQHSGNCEHLLIFTDVRLMTSADVIDMDKYPLVTYEKGGEVKCYACKVLDANMGVEGNERLPMSPAFFCQQCFEAFHYRHERRIGEFRAFPYFQMNRIIQ